MKTTKRMLIAWSLVLVTAGAARSTDQARKMSNTTWASCLIQITSDPAIFPVNQETLEALIYSSSVGGKAGREILEISPNAIVDAFRITILGSGGGVSPSSASRLGTRATGPKPTTPRRPGETTAQYEARRRAEAAARARAMAARKTSATSQATTAISGIGQTTLVELLVELPEGSAPAAEEFSKRVVELFERSLRDSFGHHLSVLEDHLNSAEEEAGRTESDLRSELERLREISASRALDRDEILHDIRRLRDSIERMELEQVSEEVTAEATLKRIAEIKDKAEAQIAEDAVTRELQRMLELNIEHLQNARKLVQTGVTSTAELADAEEKLARAKIELARRREELSRTAGGNLLESLNKKLADYSIKTAADKAYLGTYEERLREAEALLNKSGDYELISLRADIAKENLREVLLWRDRISRHMRMLQSPSVSVLGGR
jgi:hypothetical protein